MTTWPPPGIDWYYADESCAIAHGDCREILPKLPQVDLVLTDPPYGINYVHGAENIPHATKFQGVKVVGDDVSFDPALMLNYPCILWGANHYAHRLPGGGRWMIWDKRADTTGYGKAMSDVEIAWMSGPRKADRLYKQPWDGFVRDQEKGIPRVHPTQKPIALMKWCFSFAPLAEVTVDPYMGSGTTLRAAKDLGRKCIGIELELKYCHIAVDRLRQEVLAL